MEGALFDSRNPEQKEPFGAVTGGTTVRFCIEWTLDEAVYLAVREDGGERVAKIEMKANGRPGERVAEYTFAKIGLYFYRFESDVGYVCRSAPDSLGYLRGDPFGDWFIQFVYKGAYRPPTAFGGRTVYQIFPDRFYRDAVLRTEFHDRYIHSDVTEMPHFRPVDGVVKNNDFFGGNLYGVMDKIPYLKQLGVGVIYFNPIFESHSNHRYDTANYMKVDPLLGTNEQFRELCARCKKEDILVVLDGVFSHTGADSIYFNKYGRYGDGGAFNDPNSPYHSWYKWDDSPTGYHSWWNFDTLPEVNEDDPGFRAYICGEGGVIDYWLSLGADGFRLDVADELPDDFIVEIARAVKRSGSDKILIGEVWENAVTKEAYSVRRKYLLGDELDSVMNYPFRTAVIDFVREANAELFIDRVMEIVECYPKPMMDLMMNLLSTHDTERLITALVKSHGNVDREWQAKQQLTRDAYLEGVEMAKLAFALMMTLPGLPTVYYGDEIGMQGYGDPFNRAYYDWKHGDANLRSTVRELIALRTENSAFADGELIPLFNEGGCVAFLRENGENLVFVGVNRAESERRVRLGRRVFALQPWSWRIDKIR